MLDISWIEIAFVAALALIVVGPKDLPKLLKALGSAINRGRKLYRQTLAGVNTLDKEISAASGNGKSNDQIWRNYVPESVRNLPADFIPGSMTPEQHAQRREAFEVARGAASQKENSKNQSDIAGDK